MSKKCENCESHISDDLYRVTYPDGADVVICPHCPEVRKTSFEEELMNEIRDTD